ncbi:50S ribosomal protein L18 [Candidatus Roizmanbacteria bacterium]|nr:50S ribosomal protein L18 [Candidatus Roizmanbacteria bacterium]
MRTITRDRIIRRKRRVSSSLEGTTERPRISVHRSNNYIYAQAIDDVKQVTVASYSSQSVREDGKKVLKKSEEAKQVGIELAKKLIENKIVKAIFDRNRYAYNGRVKALAEGVREGGIIM